MKVKLLTLLFAFAVSSPAFAQYNIPQNNKWAFGFGAGLDFNSGSPVAIATNMYAGEGCASVSDASGNLLFYTEGTKVWDRSGAVMPGGAAIFPYATGSSTMAALIAPVIGNPNQYYVFSMEEWISSTDYCHLDYCIVDMALNGGMGDVVAATIATPVGIKFAEKMILIKGNSCDNIWLLTHRCDSAKFLAYNITSAGIAAPVVSTVGTFTGTDCYAIGQIKVSPDRKHVVSQTFPTGLGAMGTELYDFDANTGRVSNCRVLDNATAQYGADFSPNSTKLYCQEWVGPVYQYDITGATASAIVATRTSVITSSTYSDLKLAPDGRLYFKAASGASKLDCIPNPNTAGTGCGYIPDVVTFIGSGITSLDFPNTFVASNGAVPDTVYRNIFATICLTPAGYVLTPDTTGLSYQWGNGASTPTLAVTAFGKYWCRISSGCNVHIDTFIVHGDSLHTVTNAQDVKICHSGDTVKLVAHAGYSSYLWQDSTTNSYYIARAPGNYHVAYSGYCTQYVDTFRVRLNPLFFTLGPDVTVCSNYTIVPSIKDSGITYKWQDGYTGPTYSASHTGNYFVAINQDGCVAVDTVKVTFFHFSQNIPDTFICEGTPINLNLTATPPAGGKVLWNDGTTSPIKNIRESGTYWVYVSKDECEILDTVRVTTALCNCWHYLPTAFTPNGDGLNDIVRPVIQPGCNVSGYQFSIYNRWGELVFSSEIPGKGWDGMYKGEPADMGVYMYSLQFFTGVYDKQSAESGSITLIR